MATALTVPLDDWVAANSRPVKTESLDDFKALGSRRDYSTLTVEDAFSLLYHTCRARFGDLRPLDFAVKELEGPLAYSSTLTVTGSDEIGIEFPNSGRHPTSMIAKMHAAYQAVQQGVIAFLLQGQTTPVAFPHSSSNSMEPKTSPSKGNLLDLSPTLQQPLPQKPNLGPQAAPSGSKPRNIPVYDGVVPKPVMSPTKPPLKPHISMDKSPVSIINERLQKVYSAKKLHKQANTGLRWEQKKYNEGYLARMTVVLPSGAKKSYGSVPDIISEHYRKSKYPLKPEMLLNVAKRAVATYAMKLGVLDFIASEDVSGRPLTSVGPPARPAPLPARPPVASGSNQIKLNVPSVQPGPNVRPATTLPKSSSSKILQAESAQALDAVSATAHAQSENVTQPVTQAPPTDSPREPGEVSREPSPKVSNETFNADIESRYPTRERLGSYEPFVEEDEQSQSESMELESEPRGNSVISNTGRKVSPDMEADGLDEEPPKKRLKTDPPISVKPSSPVVEGEEKDMHGASYVDILSAYCVEKELPQPQVTFQRQLQSDKNAATMYHVSFVIGTRRYELSKHYESVQSAEEKLSKRILKLFGVRAKKI